MQTTDRISVGEIDILRSARVFSGITAIRTGIAAYGRRRIAMLPDEILGRDELATADTGSVIKGTNVWLDTLITDVRRSECGEGSLQLF
jgi:hypothetical protein